MAGGLIGLSAVYFDFFEVLIAFVAHHEEWQLDEVINVLLFGGLCAIVLCIRRNIQLAREVARRELAEAQAQRLARHDPLTGLANRRVFLEELDRRIRQRARDGKASSILLIDLDRFKPVNDLHGQATGDFVLCQVANRIQAAVGPDDVLARLGGDEFAIIVDAGPGRDTPMRLAQRLVSTIRNPIRHKRITVELGASVGIATFPADGRTAEDLIHAADVAQERAKRDGRGNVRSFEPGMDAELRNRQALEAKLRNAVQARQIKPHYQPLVHLETNKVVGFELLARWYDPDEGIVMPSAFISVAEDANLLSQICYSLLRQACRDARSWPGHIHLAINVSPSQFNDPALPEKLLAILSEEGFRPDRLEIEITESALVGDFVVAKQTLEKLRREGVRIAIDDFGTGYSGLLHLRELKFDKLKIDRSFIQNLDDPENATIVHAILGLGRSLGLPVTAEGIEDAAQSKKLIELGCEFGQGYYFGKPRPASANEIGLEIKDLIRLPSFAA